MVPSSAGIGPEGADLAGVLSLFCALARASKTDDKTEIR